MKKQIIWITLFSLLSFKLSAQSNQYKGYIKEYMKVVSTLKEFKSNLSAYVDVFKNNYSNAKIPAKFWTNCQKEIDAITEDDLVELFAPVYYKYYSEDDLKKILEFYNSPVGLKMQKTHDSLSAESGKVAEKWGRDFSDRMLTQLKKELE